MSDTPKPEFARVAAIPVGGRVGRARGQGKWFDFIARLRALSAGECLQFDGTSQEYLLARATLYSHKGRRPGEKVHFSYADGVVSVWLEKQS